MKAFLTLALLTALAIPANATCPPRCSVSGLAQVRAAQIAALQQAARLRDAAAIAAAQAQAAADAAALAAQTPPAVDPAAPVVTP